MERHSQSAITISTGLFRLLERRADELNSTPEQVAETILRFELDNSVHIEQRSTQNGLQAYLRGTRIAVRHVAAFLHAGFTIEEIISQGFPQIPKAAVHEAIAYYYDHPSEIEAELANEGPDRVIMALRERLTPEQIYQLTRQSEE